MFRIFVNNYTDDSMECTCSKSVDNIRLRETTDTPMFRAAMQRDLNMLEKWTDTNIMKFSKMPQESELYSRQAPGQIGGYQVEHEHVAAEKVPKVILSSQHC